MMTLIDSVKKVGKKLPLSWSFNFSMSSPVKYLFYCSAKTRIIAHGLFYGAAEKVTHDIKIFCSQGQLNWRFPSLVGYSASRIFYQVTYPREAIIFWFHQIPVSINENVFIHGPNHGITLEVAVFPHHICSSGNII